MEAQKISNNLYWVGVRDPHLKVFDIIMETKYGTSYNSYLIRGTKNILIDTVKVGFYDEYIKKLEQLLGEECIDYIIVNHTEPDHSGSIKNILARYPNAQVICSKPASMYLRAQLNEDYNCKIAADGEVLKLGDKTFKFILAPFLHWPDTMFAYYEDEKILFTCDAFGCHYCPSESKLYNDEMEDFFDVFKYYFDVIMSPFKEHVLKALDKIELLSVDMICTSHGPILRKDIHRYLDAYKDMSKDVLIKRDKKYILIGYVSAYGYTRAIADKLYFTIAENKDVDVELIDLSQYELLEIKQKIEHADGVLIGSPTFNQDALEPVWRALSHVCPINARGRLAAAFGSYGWSGEAVKMLEDRLKSLKFKVVESGLRINFAPSSDDLVNIERFANEFTEILTK